VSKPLFFSFSATTYAAIAVYMLISNYVLVGSIFAGVTAGLVVGAIFAAKN
jgi:hypothetical protein